MLKIIVIALLAGNLLLAGIHAASAPTAHQKIRFEVRQLPADLASIRLLDELEPTGKHASSNRQCFSVGPFETTRSRNTVLDLLQDRAASISERDTEALVELGYWVALPAYASFAEAGEAMRQLRRSGLEDVAVVSESTGDFRVSLGYFLEQDNARRRTEQVRELGFDAQMRLQRESQPRYWLDYELAAVDPASDPALPQEMRQELHRQIPCS